MNLTKKLIVALALSVGSLAANAVPAYPGLINATQPDGTTVAVKLHGDESLNWASTPDGYTLLRNGEGFWSFARQMKDGSIEASELVYRGDESVAVANGIEKGLKYSGAQRLELKQQNLELKGSSLQVEGTYPSTGKNKLLLLLLNYSDTQPVFTQTNFDAMMNQENYGSVGCFRDYYLENSYGKLDITTTVTRWVTLPYAKEYYGSDRAIEMIQHGLNILVSNGELDLREFDNDGDGVLDGLAVIHQGAGQEYTGGANDIWSHSSIIYGMSFNGIQVRRYTIEPELLGTTGKMSTIGVICHEFGHNLGAPDFYDTDYSENGGDYPGTGVWDLMGSGAWNGSGKGDRPANINMWQKIQLGWVNPVVLESTQKITAMPSAHNNPVAYRVNTTVPGEYYILENRQQSGPFDQALPGHGMLVYHANEEIIKKSVADNTINVGYPQGMYTVSASAGEDPDAYVSSYGSVNDASAPFPGKSNIRTLSDASKPSLRSISGRYSYKALTNIAESVDGYISFNFTAEETPAAPINLTATAEKGLVTLRWDIPAEAANQVMYYNVYRNDEAIAFTQMNEFTDRGLTDESMVTYHVDAVYINGLISPYASVSIRVPSNIITDITADITNEDVTLSWAIESRLTRMTSFDPTHNVNSYNVKSLDFVHRYRADDLKAYKGYSIRRISYLPYQSQKDLAITLRVWEADADGSNAKVVSERVVKEFGTAIWNTTLLTRSVTITGEKDLWIGLHLETTTGSIQVLSDIGPKVDGYGNWIKLEGDTWKADNVAAGNFFLYVPLTEPTATDVATLESCGTVTDVALDMFYPIGYAIYRDDQLMGWSSTRKWVDNSPLKGAHTYSIANLYKGANESVAKSLEVTFGANDIDEVNVADAAVEVARYDLCGRQLAQPAKGVNVVKMSDGTVRKEFVK
ncbi:MAG: M6 family metalloprotease domain-containing protein [Muribaculaceae bacterium]|nr:M6 family metalloprotease domain-containing protein [Muribaculaceae bacterium]